MYTLQTLLHAIQGFTPPHPRLVGSVAGAFLGYELANEMFKAKVSAHPSLATDSTPLQLQVGPTVIITAIGAVFPKPVTRLSAAYYVIVCTSYLVSAHYKSIDDYINKEQL